MNRTLLSAIAFRTANAQGATPAIQQAASPNQVTVLTDEQMDQVTGAGFVETPEGEPVFGPVLLPLTRTD